MPDATLGLIQLNSHRQTLASRRIPLVKKIYKPVGSCSNKIFKHKEILSKIIITLTPLHNFINIIAYFTVIKKSVKYFTT